MTCKLKWEPRDIWVGLYWTVDGGARQRRELALYLCIIPCLPLCIRIPLY